MEGGIALIKVQLLALKFLVTEKSLQLTLEYDQNQDQMLD